MKTSFDPPTLSPISQPRSPSTRGLSEQYRALSQEMAITLTTKEGDRITIHQGTAAAQHSLTAQGDGDFRTISQGLMEAGMSIELKGDLSYQEINDLIDLFQDLSGIASDFFNGNFAQAVEGAAKIGDMGSITELSATFSRTSVLAEYMQGYHPLPTIFEIPNDLLTGPSPHNEPDPKPGPIASSGLPALWQQFIGELITLDAPPPPPPPTPSHHSASQAGKRMLARGRETMDSHPRLTPLMPSVAALAVDQASRLFNQGQALNQLAKDLNGSFRSAFNNWVV